jgi:hypothetical protein
MDKMTDMAIMQAFGSIEDTVKLQMQAKAERRAARAAEEEKEFKEKLARAAASKAELESMASGIKGTQDAVRRDQLMTLMMAGYCR